MKISKTVLQQIIHEEAERLFKLEKLQETKRVVDENIRLISEGKKKMSDEELEELWAGLKSVLGAGAKAVGKAVGAGAEKVQQLGQKVADTYKQGENQAKIASLEKKERDMMANLKTAEANLKSVRDELSKLYPPAQLPPDKAKKTVAPKATASKTATPKTSSAKKPATSGGTKQAAPKSKATKQAVSPYSVTE